MKKLKTVPRETVSTDLIVGKMMEGYTKNR
ncbi:hypothetical protein ABIA69_001400 [Lysinibacillus parviboronicapiens]|uniref:Uncharacterized protein n=1 Tax=Lysinibacillus parviboronicapiens TaxID=436516 RepID=A0ABV2PHM5_9BACI